MSGPGSPDGEPSRVDLRLAPAAVAAWGSAWWAVTGSADPVGGWALALAVLAGVGCAVLLRRPASGRRSSDDPVPVGGPWSTVLPPTVLALAAGALVLTATAAGLRARSPDPLPHWAADRAVAEVVGTVGADPQPLASRFGGSPKIAVRLDVTEVTARGQTLRVRAPVRVIAGSSWQAAVGSRVRADLRLAPAEPGDDVVAFGAALAEPRTIRSPAWWWRGADRVRAGLRDAVDGLPAGPGGLLPSLVLGDTSLLTEQVRESLRTSGLTHLTAVSGANVAIVVGGVLAVLTRLGLRRSWRVPLAGAALVAFVIAARPEPSVVRAAVMGGVVLLGLIAGRRGAGMPVLGAAVVVLLIVDPWLARSAGFALSVAATAALLLLAPPWADRLSRWLPRPLAVAVAAPAAAQAACGPITVLLQPTVSSVAVPANLLAEPAVAPATVLGVLAAVVAPLLPPLAGLLAAMATCFTWWICQVAQWFATAPAAALPWWAGVTGAAALAVVTAGVVVVSLRVRPVDAVPTAARPSPGEEGVRPVAGGSADRRGRPSWWGRSGVSAVLVVTLVLAGLASAGLVWAALAWRRVAAPPASWAVAECDVGQGDALAVRVGGDAAILIDAGPDGAAVDRCLRRLGVRRLPLVLLTHFHADHVTGLARALAGRHPGVVLVGAYPHPVDGAEAVATAVRATGAAEVETRATRGGVLGSDGWQVRWVVVPGALPAGAGAGPTGADPADPASPDPAKPDPAKPDPANPDPAHPPARGGVDAEPDGSVVNETSLAAGLEVTSPEGAVLRLAALGDLEPEGQQRLARLVASSDQLALLRGPVDVVKVAHHGSPKQDAELYRRLGARVALIGVGAGNDYGHPARSTLDLLTGLGAAVYRTDRDRQVTIEVRPGGATRPAQPEPPSVAQPADPGPPLIVIHRG